MLLYRYLVKLILDSGANISGHRYSESKEELEKEISEELNSEKTFIFLGGEGGARSSNVVGWTIRSTNYFKNG